MLAALLLAPTLAAALPVQEIAKAAGPSVVHLSIRDARGKEEGSGSGFVISEDGRVATNHHVVDESERMVAVFPDGREVEVVGIVAFDKDADVAIVQLKAGKYPPLRLAPAKGQAGDEIVVIGSPLGLGHSITTGIISAVREHGTKTAAYEDGIESWQLQITATIAQGSSGSPILNAGGEVVGVVVGLMDLGVYFGVPAHLLKVLVDKKPGALQPLAAAHSERSVRTNLLISAGLLGAIGLGLWIHSYVQRRRLRTVPPTRHRPR
jgi:S1-C subfamily serine protease